MVDKDSNFSSDEAVENLLRNVPPRPMPPEPDAAIVRDAVRAEWRTVTGRRRRLRRVTTFAAAASVVLAVAFTINALRVPSAADVQVATIDRSVGSIFLLGDGSEMQQMQDLKTLSVGETIETDSGSGVGLAWLGGGMLRIDENTRVEFATPTEVVLHHGRVYFDSQPSELYAGITQSSVDGFSIRTEQGVVTHVGTQYMTGINAGALQVSVREGQVRVDGAYFDAEAQAGERLEVTGGARPSVTNINGHGADWHWVEMTAPVVDVDERSIYEFLAWVSRESGLALRFEGESERIARARNLVGTADWAPRESLRILMDTTVLKTEIDNGWIVISKR